MDGASYERAWAFMEGDTEGRFYLEVKGSTKEVKGKACLSERVCDRDRGKALRCGF